MFRFDAKKGFYFYPEMEDEEDAVMWLNRGSTYEKNVEARDDVCIIKHGFKIPTGLTEYEAFSEQMRYLSVIEIAKKWDVSERGVRNYCAKGRVNGAFLTGKTWNIPENAEKPERTSKRKEEPVTLLDILKEQKAAV